MGTAMISEKRTLNAASKRLYGTVFRMSSLTEARFSVSNVFSPRDPPVLPP